MSALAMNGGGVATSDENTQEKLRILIADDNDSDRLILQTIVKKQGHTVLTAIDGRQAIEIYDRERPDIVLLDALMPNVDGFGAARAIKRLAGEDLVPIIFLTSLRDAASLADCLEAGGSDFLSKPYNRVILQAKIAAFARMRKLHATIQAQRDEISRHHDHLIQEQEVAKAVFDNIAHPGCVGADNIKCLISPMAVFNGDMVLAARKPDGGMFVLLGDFTGHGLPAAIGAMPASEIFYGMTQKGFGLQEILREINKKLKSFLPVGVFCCAAMIDLNMRDHMVEVWVGGLPDLILLHEDTKELEMIGSKNLPLGVLSDEKFATSTNVFEMRPGDKIYLWSDGIHEAMNSSGEMFGSERIERLFRSCENSDHLFEDLQSAIESFTGEEAQDDDHTIVEIKMVDEADLTGADYKSVQGTSIEGPMEWVSSFELRPQTLRSFNPLPLVTHILMQVPGLRAHSGKLYTILSELYSNALEHGILGLSSEMKSTPQGFSEYYKQREAALASLTDAYIKIYMEHSAEEKGGVLKVRIEDSGNGFDFNGKINNELKDHGYCGRGIPLIETMCRQLKYFGKGNIVEIEFSWQLG